MRDAARDHGHWEPGDRFLWWRHVSAMSLGMPRTAALLAPRTGGLPPGEGCATAHEAQPQEGDVLEPQGSAS